MQVASQKFSTKNKATNIINSANHNSKPRKQTSKQHRPSTATPFVSSHFIRRRAQQTLYRKTLQNHRKIIGVHQGNLYLKTWFAVRPPHKYRIKQTWWPVTMILLDSKPKPNIFASLPQKFICPHLNYPRNPQPPSNLPPPRLSKWRHPRGRSASHLHSTSRKMTSCTLRLRTHIEAWRWIRLDFLFVLNQTLLYGLVLKKKPHLYITSKN